jgi:hypothetical protein
MSAGSHPAPNYSPKAVFDDSILSDGALVHAEIAVRALRRHGQAPRSAAAGRPARSR